MHPPSSISSLGLSDKDSMLSKISFNLGRCLSKIDDILWICIDDNFLCCATDFNTLETISTMVSSESCSSLPTIFLDAFKATGANMFAKSLRTFKISSLQRGELRGPLFKTRFKSRSLSLLFKLLTLFYHLHAIFLSLFCTCSIISLVETNFEKFSAGIIFVFGATLILSPKKRVNKSLLIMVLALV